MLLKPIRLSQRFKRGVSYGIRRFESRELCYLLLSWLICEQLLPCYWLIFSYLWHRGPRFN
jgi:hypothetical protein